MGDDFLYVMRCGTYTKRAIEKNINLNKGDVILHPL